MSPLTRKGPKPRSVIDRFVEKIGEPDTNGCWPWIAYTAPSGHGTFYAGGNSRLAHRIAYELFVGPLSNETDLHHRCENPTCVNPAHLDPLDSAEHRRLHATRPFGGTCSKGHPWIEENLYRYKRRDGTNVRMCKTCQREASSRRYKLQRATAL